MDSRLTDLSGYRLSRAREALETASLDYAHGLYAAS